MQSTSGRSNSVRRMAATHPFSTRTSSSVNAMTSARAARTPAFRPWDTPMRGSKMYRTGTSQALKDRTTSAVSSVELLSTTMTSNRTPLVSCPTRLLIAAATRALRFRVLITTDTSNASAGEWMGWVGAGAGVGRSPGGDDTEAGGRSLPVPRAPVSPRFRLHGCVLHYRGTIVQEWDREHVPVP